MTENVENLLLEPLKKIQAEQSVARERDREIMTRLGSLGSMIARIGGDSAHGL
ncbi:hypothetical protein [Novosphingobium sp. fls2-241-R2A-195]|uniref:hypothetical protein n=1 Tax=Novosphingobium sp. fls2-241-R2A-195 TaxID=3040296 RepID=UPI002550F016|nr:hypothetical protein [Novosphingobium sp. fls2-241-R2A-195]